MVRPMPSSAYSKDKASARLHIIKAQSVLQPFALVLLLTRPLSKAVSKSNLPTRTSIASYLLPRRASRQAAGTRADTRASPGASSRCVSTSPAMPQPQLTTEQNNQPPHPAHNGHDETDPYDHPSHGRDKSEQAPGNCVE